jgi:Type II secretion system (T2SS), protein F
MSLLKELGKYAKFHSFWNTRADFYRDLAQSVQDKELLRDFIDGELQISLSSRTRDADRAKALSAMQVLMQAGYNSIDEVLAPVMPEGDLMGLAVVRDAKDRAGALKNLANNIEQQNAMTKVVRLAMASPSLLLPVGFAFAYILSTYSIPAFEKAAPPEVWVGYSALVRDCAQIFAKWGLVSFVLAFLLATWFFGWGLGNLTSMWRYKAENARGWAKPLWLILGPVQPLLSIYRDVQSSRMLANLAVYLQNGRGLQDALSDLAQSTSPWMRKHLQWVLEHLQILPGDYVGAFSHGVLSPQLLSRLHSKVRRDAGQDFSRVLIDIGTAGQEKSREDVKKAAGRANFILLLLTLGIVMFFYFGQSWIVFQIQEESSPTKVQMRALQKKERNALQAH